jgi:hypothetical protein
MNFLPRDQRPTLAVAVKLNPDDLPMPSDVVPGQPVECTICGVKCPHFTALKKHMVLLHVYEPCRCTVCQETFKNTYQAYDHLKKKHAEMLT